MFKMHPTDFSIVMADLDNIIDSLIYSDKELILSSFDCGCSKFQIPNLNSDLNTKV